MTWALSSAGNVHWYDTDTLGLVSRCGKSRPELPPKPAPTGATPCPRCVHLFAGRLLKSPAHDPAPEQNSTNGRREEAEARYAAIRTHVSKNPGQSKEDVGRAFGVASSVVQKALKPSRTDSGKKGPVIEAMLRADPKASITAISREVGCTVTYVQQVRQKLRYAKPGEVTP